MDKNKIADKITNLIMEKEDLFDNFDIKNVKINNLNIKKENNNFNIDVNYTIIYKDNTTAINNINVKLDKNYNVIYDNILNLSF